MAWFFAVRLIALKIVNGRADLVAGCFIGAHCVDINTGRTVWQHDVGSIWCASATVADGRVFIGTERLAFWVLRAGREKEVLGRGRLRSVPITTVGDSGTLYLPTQRRLFAIRLGQ